MDLRDLAEQLEERQAPRRGSLEKSLDLRVLLEHHSMALDQAPGVVCVPVLVFGRDRREDTHSRSSSFALKVANGVLEVAAEAGLAVMPQLRVPIPACLWRLREPFAVMTGRNSVRVTRMRITGIHPMFLG
jgi:hypothetical protein